MDERGIREGGEDEQMNEGECQCDLGPGTRVHLVQRVASWWVGW